MIPKFPNRMIIFWPLGCELACFSLTDQQMAAQKRSKLRVARKNAQNLS